MKPLNDTVDSIREINLSYLTLARRLLQEDNAVGMRCLGLSKEIADTLTALTLAQVVKFAESNHLLCSFRFDDHAMLSALTYPITTVDVTSKHAAAPMSGQQVVQFA